MVWVLVIHCFIGFEENPIQVDGWRMVGERLARINVWDINLPVDCFLDVHFTHRLLFRTVWPLVMATVLLLVARGLRRRVRKCEEEALITPNVQSMIAVVDVVHAEQVHVFYRATIDDDSFGAGEESLDVKLYRLDEIPWDLIAFETVKIALNAQIEKDANDESPIYRTIQ